LNYAPVVMNCPIAVHECKVSKTMISKP